MAEDSVKDLDDVGPNYRDTTELLDKAESDDDKEGFVNFWVNPKTANIVKLPTSGSAKI